MTPPLDLTAESNGAYQIMVKWKVIRLLSLFFFNIIIIIIIIIIILFPITLCPFTTQ